MLAKDKAASINADLAAHTTPEQWADESHELAVKVAYADGGFEPANIDDHPESADIPIVKEAYAENAGVTARLCAAKGGKRLASMLKTLVSD
jgi:hypothetical protein